VADPLIRPSASFDFLINFVSQNRTSEPAVRSIEESITIPMILEVKIPSPGESITEVEIESWLVKSGDYVEMDDELAEISSDKATLTINAEEAGVIQLLVKEGDTVSVGQAVAQIDTEAKAAEGKAGTETPKSQPEKEKAAVADPVVVSSQSYASGHPSVSAEKLLKEKQIDPSKVDGSGRDGRLTKTDVVNYLNRPQEPEAKEQEKPKAPDRPIPDLPLVSGGVSRSQHREKMSRLRRRIAERLVSVKNETAMLTTFNEVDMQAIMDLRKKYKEKFKEVHGVGLGFMSFFMKACAMALQEFPAVNAQIDGQELIFHDYVDMGIAVSTERGLVVPNIRNAESLSLAELEQAVLHFALKARENEITIQDMEGGTFSITNGGIFGSMLSTPILNPPQSAILGMHNIVERPVAINGNVQIRPIMYVALSYDHRVIDGKEAVSFLLRVKERLEDPSRLMLGV
jgi:2-oxoglutarate dehydrogenase E2 component (dihydrolipoamide succinyltransferase)